MIDFIASEEDIGAILRSDRVNVISDSTYPTEGVPHPRLYGTFPRILEKYVRQDGVLTLPEAVHRMTDAPAQSLRIAGRDASPSAMTPTCSSFDPAAVHEAGDLRRSGTVRAGNARRLCRRTPGDSRRNAHGHRERRRFASLN